MKLKRGVAIGLLVILAAAGCAAGEDDAGVATVGSTADDAASASSTPSPMTDEERRMKFAQCMREQGVELPDPEIDGGRVTVRAPEGVDPKRADAAMEKCRQYLPDEAVLSQAALRALQAGGPVGPLADLVRRRVIVDLPRRYY